MKIELDDEVIDNIVCVTIGEHIKMCKANIKRLKKQSELQPFEKEDLANNISTLDALNEVFDYFGGNL